MVKVKDASYWCYLDGEEEHSNSNLPYTHGTIQCYGWAGGDAGTFNWIFVRKYASTEPTVNIGAEESSISFRDFFGGNASVGSTANVTLSAGSFTIDTTETETLRPTGNGTATSEGKITNQTPNDGLPYWQKVDEVTADEDSTMIYQAFSSEDEIWRGNLFTIPDHSISSGNISSVTVYYRVRRSVTSSRDAWARAVVRTHNTQYNGTTQTITPFETWTTYSQTWTTNPNTGNAWTRDEIDALEIGVGLKHDYLEFPCYCGSRAECTQVYAVVIYATYTGKVVSDSVAPLNLQNWDSFVFDDAEPASTDIKYRIEYYTGSAWALIPDSALSGNSAGFDTSPVDLVGLDATAYTQIRIRATLSTTDTSATPTLSSWRITWNGWQDGIFAWDKVDSTANVTAGTSNVTLSTGLSHTAFTDGFETDLTKWDGNGGTSWYRASDKKKAGSWSVKSDSDQEGTLTSDDINLSDVLTADLDFWYMLDDTDDSDFELYLYSGSGYNLISQLGGGSEDTWLNYDSVSIDLGTYNKSNFRVRFNGDLEYPFLGSEERVWVDAVVVSTTTYYTSGNVTFDSIQPANLDNWDVLAWDDVEPTSTDIKYQLQYYSGGSWHLISDSDLSGKSAGFDTSPISLEGLDAGTYTKIRVIAKLTTTDGTTTPAINSVRVTFNGCSDGKFIWEKVWSTTNATVGDNSVTVTSCSSTTEDVFPTGDSSIAVPDPVGTHWDDVSDDNDATKISTGSCAGTGWYDDLYSNNYEEDDFPDGQIIAVSIVARCAASDTAYEAAKTLFYDGTLHTGDAWTIAGSLSWTNYTRDITSFRTTWSWDDIVDCTFGISLKGGQCSNTAQCARIYLHITYYPAGVITSDAITPYFVGEWNTFYGNHTIPSGANITYEILEATGNTTLCTLTAAQAAAGANITACAANTTSIRVRAAISCTGSTSARLHNYKVTWDEEARPAVGTPALWDTEASPSQVSEMNPQVEYNIKVSVSDYNTLNDLSTVRVTLFYDSDGSYSEDDVPSSGNTSTAAILTWTNGGSPAWTINPAASTTWSIVTGNCSAPTLSNNSGTFQFHFKPGKVAKETTGTDKWHIFAEADDGNKTGSNYAANKEMNWYGEISVNTVSVNWGSVTIGSDFSSNVQTGISVKYTCNGNYTQQVKASSPWGSSPTLALNAAGTPGAGEFSLKADDTSTLGSAVLISSASYTTIDTGTITSENGNTESSNTLWLKLGPTGGRGTTYTGTIYYQIADN